VLVGRIDEEADVEVEVECEEADVDALCRCALLASSAMRFCRACSSLFQKRDLYAGKEEAFQVLTSQLCGRRVISCCARNRP